MLAATPEGAAKDQVRRTVDGDIGRNTTDVINLVVSGVARTVEIDLLNTRRWKRYSQCREVQRPSRGGRGVLAHFEVDELPSGRGGRVGER